MKTMAELTATHAQEGSIAWIGIRPTRRADVLGVARVAIGPNGLEGDHRARPGKRAVTLIQAEHLPVIASLSGANPSFADLRRNIAVSGINLAALRGARVRLGAATLRITGVCAPCSRMEEILGPGGYNALRGHGGWTAEVLEAGVVALGDTVSVL
ncbi:MAG: MOSC domain-containing protein [Rubricella sp.]